MQVEETIAAIASSHDGGGLRGIVRVSGPNTVNTVSSVFQSCHSDSLESVGSAQRISGEFQVRAPFGPVPVDLHLWPTDRSYTRQPTAELHTYGSTPLLSAMVETLCDQGARLAKPGEFTLRAFLAGRIDLSQAEAVLGVIDAADDRELSVALEQLAGGLSQPLDQIRNTLLNLCADLEAGLDFVEDDIEFVSSEQIARELSSARTGIESALREMQNCTEATQLPRVVLRGEPNAGKSSLWNALCQSDTTAHENAIVTDVAGTTRDYLAGVVDRNGHRFKLIDTAGVEHGSETLDRKLRTSSDHQAEIAELVLLCIDGSRPLTQWELDQLSNGSKAAQTQIAMLTKSDLVGSRELDFLPDARTSATDVRSLDGLVERCGEELKRMSLESSVVNSTALRCRNSLHLARESVQRAESLVQSSGGDELIAVELRSALEHLGQIVGVIYTDDILDRIFSRFCIGK